MVLDKLRKMFIDMLTYQLKVDTGVSTRMNLYIVEVELLKNVFYVFTGQDPDDEDDDGFHDWVCNVIDTLHHKFDC